MTKSGPDESQFGPRRYDLDRVVRLLLSAGGIIATILLLRYLSDVLIPFAIAMVIAYLLHPIVNLVERRIRNRAAAVLITVIGGMVLIVAAVVLSIPFISAQIDDFQGMLAGMRSDVADQGAGEEGLTIGQRFDRFVETRSDDRVRWVLEKVRATVTSEDFDLEGYVIAAVRRIAPGVLDVLTGTLSFVLGLTGVIVVVLYVIFLLNDFRLVENVWKDQLPPRYRESLVQFLNEFQIAMSRYFRGQFVVAMSVGVLFAIGFSLIGIRMGVVLGLFVGMLNMVPYLQIVGLIPAGVLAVLRAVELDSSVMVSVLLTLAVFGVVQLIQDALLTPRIMGKATGLRPAVILLGVFIWGKLLGFLGLVLAIPLTCLGLAYYRRWVLNLKDAPVMAEETA